MQTLGKQMLKLLNYGGRRPGKNVYSINRERCVLTERMQMPRDMALPISIAPDGPHGGGHHHDGGRGDHDHDHADDGEHRELGVKYWPAPDLLSCEFFSSKPS